MYGIRNARRLALVWQKAKKKGAARGGKKEESLEEMDVTSRLELQKSHKNRITIIHQHRHCHQPTGLFVFPCHELSVQRCLRMHTYAYASLLP